MAVLPPLKIRRHIPIILALFLLFTKDLKEGHIVERYNLLDREVDAFSIQVHHILAVGVLLIVLMRYRRRILGILLWNLELRLPLPRRALS